MFENCRKRGKGVVKREEEECRGRGRGFTIGWVWCVSGLASKSIVSIKQIFTYPVPLLEIPLTDKNFEARYFYPKIIEKCSSVSHVH